MTVAAPTYTEKTWQGDGSTTVFSFQTLVEEASDLEVIFTENDTESVKSLTTHYTLSGLGDPAGVTMTLLTAATADQQVTIRRNTVPKQTINYSDLGKVPGDTTEAQLDRFAMAMFDLRNRVEQIQTTADISGLIEDFDKRYLGAFAAEPDTDNDGEALLDGALFFDTVVGQFKVWNGLSWQLQSTALANGDVTEPKLASALSNFIPQVVTTRTALKAMSTTRYKAASLTEEGRAGLFVWTLGDFSAHVAADVSGGQYIKADAVAATTGAWVRQFEGPVDIRWHGASPSASAGDNEDSLREAYLVNQERGYGNILIPPGINYGYDLTDTTTYPNMLAKADAVDFDFVIHDFGVGNTYTAPSKDGPQERIFFYHVETSPPGMHDGNILIINGDWPPGLVINNHAQLAAVGDPSRTAYDNRRCHIFFFNDGLATWRIGQGSNTGAALDDDELSSLIIAVNDVPDLGITGLTGVLEILKTNLNMRLDVSQFDLFFRSTGTSKLRNMSTSEATDVLEVWENSVNKIQWDVTTGASAGDPGMTLAINASTKLRFLRNGGFEPGADNTQALGSTTQRWATVYAGTGTINTSDLREKLHIVLAAQDEAALRAVRRIGINRYQWKSAVAEKGEDGARLHFGVIAQEVFAAFEAEGLDAFRYGLMCYDEWEDQFEETREQAKDDSGNLLWDDFENGQRVARVEVKRTLVRAAGNRWGVRDNELQYLMIAAERARNDELEARLAALEAV